MPPPAVNNGMLSELLQTGKFSDCTIVCEGKEFKLHKVVVCAQSPVITAALEKASKESQTSSLAITSFNLVTVECMVDFLYHEDYVINGDALHKANTTMWTHPPNTQVNGVGSRMPATPPPSFPPPMAMVRDIILCHVEVNAIGHHYKLPKLCDRANQYLEAILFDDKFPMEIFPDLAIVAYKSSEDPKLHDMVSSFALGRINTLAKTPGFEKVNTLPNFSFNLLQKTAAKLETNMNQLVEIRGQRLRDQQSIERFEDEFSSLKQQLEAISAGRDLVIKKNAELTTERDHARRVLDEEMKQKEAAVSGRKRAKQDYETERTRAAALLSSRDSLQQALDAEKRKYTTLSSQRSTLQQQVQDLTSQHNSLTAQQNTARDEVAALRTKMVNLLDTLHNHESCRNCGNDFGCWVQDAGARYILRCDNCRCRHYN